MITKENLENCYSILASFDGVFSSLALTREQHESFRKSLEFIRTILDQAALDSNDWASKYADQVNELKGELLDTTLNGIPEEKTINL